MKAELVDHMGSDLSVVNAARVSMAKQSEWVEVCTCGQTSSSQGWPCTHGGCDFHKELSEKDRRLIQYLARHDHWTPFAHTAITLRMSAPVPIRTQCFKHKQGLVENEESRRYISCTPELFVPESFRMKPEGSVKQGSGGVHPNSDFWLALYGFHCADGIKLYEDMIAAGICPEQARFVLPQGVKVNWVWTGNVYAFANFYNKRTDPHAQKEIQQLALLVGEVIKPLFPVSWAALTCKEVSTNA